MLGTALSGAQAATAGGPVCGRTITADTVLRADVTGCSGTAIAIGADGVTLDLDGHRVEGAIVASGRAGVEIRNGVVAGDVRLDGVRHASVRRLQLRRGSISCVRSAGCTIVRNRIAAGGIAIAEAESGFANSIHANAVRRAPRAGISVTRADTTSIGENVVRRSGSGIEVSHAADLRIAGNLLADNLGTGLGGSFGATATIARNVIASNGGDGISLRIWGGETVIARNSLLGNRRGGLRGMVVAHWRVTRNLAARNGESGIAIGGAVDDTTLDGNRARRNGGLGIDAGSGVADGGGNTATANGAAAQCAGLSCG